MGNRYKEVFLTYLRRPFSSWQTGIWIYFSLYELFLGPPPGGRVSAASLMFAVILLGSALWLHFREQMTGLQRQLAPRFIWTHIAVFLTLSISLVVVCALLLLRNASLEVPETVCLLLLVYGYIGFCVASQIRALPYLGVGGFLWMLTSAIPASARPFIPTDSPAVRLAVASLGAAPSFAATAGLGVAASLGAIAWMARITEEHWSYSKPIEFALYSEINRTIRGLVGRHLRNSRDTGKTSTAASRVPAYRNAPIVHSGPLRAALHRWHHTDIFQARLLLVLVPIVSLVLLDFALGHKRPGNVMLGLKTAYPFILVLPCLLAASQWLKRWPFLETESLRPEGRRQFIKGVFITVAVQILFVWLAFAGAIALIAIIDGDVFNGWTCLALYSASLLVQPFGYVLCCWILSHRRLATLFALAAAAVEYKLSLGYAAWGIRPLVTIATTLMILGLILIPSVYRRWMNLELG